MYCQIVGKKSLKRSVFTITLCCFLKSTCGIAQSTNVKSGNMTYRQVAGFQVVFIFFLLFICFFYRIKVIIWKRKGIKFILWVFRGQDCCMEIAGSSSAHVRKNFYHQGCRITGWEEVSPLSKDMAKQRVDVHILKIFLILTKEKPSGVFNSSSHL